MTIVQNDNDLDTAWLNHVRKACNSLVQTVYELSLQPYYLYYHVAWRESPSKMWDCSVSGNIAKEEIDFVCLALMVLKHDGINHKGFVPFTAILCTCCGKLGIESIPWKSSTKTYMSFCGLSRTYNEHKRIQRLKWECLEVRVEEYYPHHDTIT